MEQIGYLVNLGVIPHLCKMLTVKESKVILVILDALGNILLVRTVSINPLTLTLLISYCSRRAISVAQLDAPSDWRPGGRGFNPR